MAYDAETFATSAQAAPSVDQLRALSPDKARQLYDLAGAVRVPIVWEIAAHAAAGALATALADLEATRRELKALRANQPVLQPVAPISPEAPTTARKPKGQSARAKAPPAGDDLAAALPMPPKAKRAAGTFYCAWADGSGTKVSGVVYHAAKPETRWAAAFQAADRLRRGRGRHDYAKSLSQSARLVGRWETRGGVVRETAAWQELLRLRPMPALVAIFDDTSREMFEPAEIFGAGEPDRCRILEAAMTIPRKPWEEAEAAADGWTVGLDWSGEDAVCWDTLGRTTVGGGAHLLAGWSARQCDVQRRHAEAAWAEVVPAPQLEIAEVGAPISPAPLADLVGTAVVVDLERAEARLKAGFAKDDPAARERFGALRSLVRLAAGVEQQPRYTLGRGAGGLTFSLTDSLGRIAHFRADILEALALAA